MKKIFFALLILPFTSPAQTWTLVGSAGFTDGTARNTSIAINGIGTPYLAYTDSINGGKATVMKFNGSGWVTVGSAGFSDSGGAGGYNNWLAIGSNDTPFVAYEDGGYSGKATMMKYNGSSWDTVGSPGFSWGSAPLPSLAIDTVYENYYVAFYDNYFSGKASVMEYNGTYGSVWAYLGTAGFSTGAAYYVSIAIGASPDIFVAYEDGAAGKATVMQYNGSTWVNVYPSDFSAGIAQYTQIAIDGSGNIYVAYEDGANGDKVTVMEHAYGTFGWSTVGSPGFSAGVSDYLSLALNGSGTPYVAYRDNGNSEKATVMKFNGSSWVTVGSAGFSTGMAVFTSLAIDGTGTPYVAYMDAANSDKATVMKFSNAPITGVTTLCVGDTTTLHDTTSGGIWNSSNTSIASIGTSTGFLTGIAGGTVTISYTKSGISSILTITVNPLPAAGIITGVSSVCIGSSITLADIVTDGVWSSSNTSLATIGTGIVTGVSTGLDTIKYTFTNICGTAIATKNITINLLPSGITGTTNICTGVTTTLDDISTGGAWSSSSTSIATIGTTGVVDGVVSGTAIITYSLPSGCTKTTILTVNPLPVAGIITGIDSVCVGSNITLIDTITGGLWSSSNSSATISGGIVTGVAMGMDTIRYLVTNSCGVDTALISIKIDPLPMAGAITGLSVVCVSANITLTEASTGGIWSVSNSSLATVSVGVVTGIVAGVDTTKYTVTNSCGIAIETKTITISPLPIAGIISGMNNVCLSANITLSDASTGGIWSASNGNALVSGIGVVHGYIVGIDTVIYTITNSCGTDTAISIITVNPLPVAGTLSGTDSVCISDTIFLIDAIAGGSWSASNGNAFVSSAGVVLGISAGTDNITYSFTNACGTAITELLINVTDCDAGVKIIGSQKAPFVTIFPNPNRGFFTINISTADNEDAQIIFTNIFGEKVKELTIPTNKETSVQLQNPAGIYFISAITKNESTTTKIAVE